MEERFMIMRIKQPRVILIEKAFELEPVVEKDTVTIKYFASTDDAKKEIEARVKGYQPGPYIILPAYF
jgi:hypothetical protein